MARIFRRLSQMFDLDETDKVAGNVVAVNATEDGYELVEPTAGSGGAPTDATYITQTANSELDNEQALSALATGLVKVTNGTGVLSTATGGTDYANASHQHAGEDITSGVVADARIASTIARDSEVTSAISALSSVYQAKDTTLDTYAGIDPSANVQSVLGAADYAAIRTLLGLVIGTNVQAFDADLSTWAGLTPSANAQSLVTAANYAAMRTLLDLEAGTDFPSLATFNDHSARHENGGSDEISIAGLDGTPTELTNHLNDTSDAHDASAISVADSGGNFTGTDVEAVLAELQDNIDSASGTGAPTDATYITQTANGSLSAEQALSGLSTGILKVTTGTGVLSTATANTDYAAATHASRHQDGGADEISIAGLSGTSAALQAHLDDTSDAHAGSAITNTPAGNIAATTVQAALNELDSEKTTAAAALSAAQTEIADQKRVVEILVTDPNGDALTTGDGKAYFRVPSLMNGHNLVSVAASVSTASSSGLPTVQIRNATQTADMLSTRITIDANETDSSTAATAAVIDTSNDDVATGDQIYVDVDVAGTGTKGLLVSMTFEAP